MSAVRSEDKAFKRQRETAHNLPQAVRACNSADYTLKERSICGASSDASSLHRVVAGYQCWSDDKPTHGHIGKAARGFDRRVTMPANIWTLTTTRRTTMSYPAVFLTALSRRVVFAYAAEPIWFTCDM